MNSRLSGHGSLFERVVAGSAHLFPLATTPRTDPDRPDFLRVVFRRQLLLAFDTL